MKIGIIGYGKMGSGIFKLLAGKDFEVGVYVRDEVQCEQYRNKFFKGLERACKRRRITAEQLEYKKETLKFTSRYQDLADADLVIETATEEFDVKSSIFAKLEEVSRNDTVLVTNTSSISLNRLAEKLANPSRFCGLHFFYPVLLINLVEIIRADGTSEQTVGFLKDFVTEIGKYPITVLDAPGSVINAILVYYYAEALYLLEEGWLPPSKIDELAKRYFYVGPCESMDIIGIDFFLNVLEGADGPGGLCPIVREGEFGEEIPSGAVGGRQGFYIPRLLSKLIEANRLGRKVSRGIFIYEREKPVDDTLEFYRDPRRTASNPQVQDEDLAAKRLLYAIFNGTLFSLAKKMSTYEDLDLGVREILQMRNGPFSTMHSMGLDKVKEDFDLLASVVGKRFLQQGLELLPV